MTIRDLTKQIEIQGRVSVRRWDDEKNCNFILMESDDAVPTFPKDILDEKITCMYAIDEIGLIIEVK